MILIDLSLEELVCHNMTFSFNKSNQHVKDYISMFGRHTQCHYKRLVYKFIIGASVEIEINVIMLFYLSVIYKWFCIFEYLLCYTVYYTI